MSDNKKKQKLLNENKDMYISEYDKTLSYDALNRIIGAKRDFIDAAKNNDKEGMTKAHDIADAVRAKYGSYTGGDDGSEYHPFSYHEDGYGEYESKYEDELDRLYSIISQGDDSFEYNHEEDPVYRAYKSLYEKQGSLAYDRALAENSIKTGGMPNTNAQSAAMQALSYYNSQLASKIPELYKAAYDRYYDEDERKRKVLQNAYDIIKNREERDYDRFLDGAQAFRDDREYRYDLKKDEIDTMSAMELLETKLLAQAENQKNNNEFKAEQAQLTRDFNAEQSGLERDFRANEAQQEREFDAEQSNVERLFDSYESKLDREHELNLSELDLQGDFGKLMYSILRDAIEDEKWRNEYNLDARKQGASSYSGTIGSGDILGYARKVFQNPNLTLDDLYSLFGL